MFIQPDQDTRASIAAARRTSEPVFNWRLSVAVLLAVLASVAIALFVLPIWLPGLSASLARSDAKVYWYLSRAAAFVAYILLWLAIVMGLLITNKLSRIWPGGPLAFDLHQHLSIIGLGFALFHALILLGDAYSNYSLAQLLLPFGSEQYRPFWVGLGQIGFYIMLLVAFSFFLRRWIGAKGWRTLHFLSFAVFVLALVHGVGSGTDTAPRWAQAIYWASATAVIILTIYRIVAARLKPARQMRQRLAEKQFAH
jgi:predicted ferric reductase